MERVHELNQLKASDVALTSFLTRYAERNSERIRMLQGVESLDTIVGRASQGAHDSGEIDKWMREYMPLAKKSSLSAEDRERISALILEIQRGVDSEISSERMSAEVSSLENLRQKVQIWRTRSSREIETPSKADPIISQSESIRQTVPIMAATPRRKIVLRKQPEEAKIDLTQKFMKTLWAEMEFLDATKSDSRHALSRLDDILNYAEAKTDPMYIHLAASFIYFLKREGYKMAPYVGRLRRVEKKVNQQKQSMIWAGASEPRT